jgi:HK97 family phage major capsid protein
MSEDNIKVEDVQKEVNELVAKGVEEAVGKIDADYKVKFEAWKKEQEELSAKRAGLQNSEVKDKRSALNATVRKFITALQSNDGAVLKELSEGTDNKGGYTVPTEISYEIEHLMTQYGVARREMFVTPMTSDTLKINNLATDVSVYWTDEATAKTSSDVVLGQVTLSLKKIAVIVPMSDELLEDTAVDIVGFLTERIAEKMAEKEDLAFFKGDGSGTYGSFTGILKNTSTNSVTMTGTGFSSLDCDDLIDMEDATPAGVLANSKYFMHRTILNVVRKLKSGTTQEYIFSPATQGAPAMVNGYPVVKVEAMPAIGDSAANTAFVLFGDMRKACWLGYKGGLKIAISSEATVRNTAGNADIDLFRSDMTALRVVERVGYVAVLPTAVTRLKTNSASS